MKKFSMKKTTAAAVAAAVGAALLLGGAGTLAYWSDTAASSTQIVNAGKLDLGATVTAGTWKVSNGTTIVDQPLTGKVVPGDQLKAEFLVPAELVGQNLKSELKVTPSVPAGTLSSKVTVKVAIATDAATTVTSSSTPIVKEFTPTTLAAASTGGNVKVTVTVDFPFGTAVDNTSIDTALSAISLAYELKQIANS
ncbi:alternate signal-mediated exported protein [Mycetocola sp. CAN_C7]|uniref:alternate-type signal peptide domain-containing protein n=1 Tax=Mycetocola sp. CAN_C7 TaxID=2787724 RepID=UPI0018CAEE3F